MQKIVEIYFSEVINPNPTFLRIQQLLIFQPSLKQS